MHCSSDATCVSRSYFLICDRTRGPWNQDYQRDQAQETHQELLSEPVQ